MSRGMVISIWLSPEHTVDIHNGGDAVAQGRTMPFFRRFLR